MKVGVIGLGQMGSAMATALLQADHELIVYDRTPAKAEHLAAAGARLAASVAAACGGEAVVTMLAHDEAVDSVVRGDGGVIASLGAGTVHISSSTISVALSSTLAREHAARGQRYVAAPVFGRPEAAARARLVVVAAGEHEAIEAVMPLLSAISTQVFRVGAQAEAANLIKLGGNFLIASVIEALGEAFALIDKGGIDRQSFRAIVQSLFDVPAYNTYAGLIANGQFEPAGFAAPLGQKDIRLLLAAAEQLEVPMPLASLLRDRFLRLIAQGGARLDWSAIGQLAARDAGLVDRPAP
jgi:3-hydroxyisobutyrate dehydrogenase-like beta-hydroxyacid dehydrogenase